MVHPGLALCPCPLPTAVPSSHSHSASCHPRAVHGQLRSERSRGPSLLRPGNGTSAGHAIAELRRRQVGGGLHGERRRRDVTASSGKGFGAPEVQVDEGERRQGVGKGGGGGEGSRGNPQDAAFEEKLAAVRKAAQEKKKAEGAKMYAAIDYDNPEPVTIDTGFFTKDIGAKIGIGIAATVFAFIFAFGEILPPPEAPSNSPRSAVSGSLTELTPQLRKELEAQLQAFEETLKTSASDRTALEGAAVLSVELGNLPRADELLARLEKIAPGETEVLRLHAEVLFSLDDYGGSTGLYRKALKISAEGGPSIELLQGLSESLIADNKPKEAVDELLSAKKEVAKRGDAAGTDPVQLDLLLGKAFAAWGKTGDAAAIYDGLISSRPDDFRGYLAKALLLQSQGKEGDAQRMFLQAKFLAPEGTKGLVDRLARS